MSNTCEKVPLEGDTNLLPGATHSLDKTTIQKRKVLRKAKSIGPTSDVNRLITSDSKQPGSGVRLVWRTTSTAELESLSKVLGISTTNKRARSPSPKPPSFEPSDSVFSETFDPLAVHKREIKTPEDSIAKVKSDTLNNSPTSNPKRIFNRRSTSLTGIEMPSVKNLKSLFETINKDVEESRKRNSVKRFYSLSEADLLSRKHKQRMAEKKPDLTVIKPAQSVESVKKDSVTESLVKDSKEMEAKESEVKLNGSNRRLFHSQHVEADHLPPVRDLRSMFERSQSIPSQLNEKQKVTNKKASSILHSSTKKQEEKLSEAEKQRNNTEVITETVAITKKVESHVKSQTLAMNATIIIKDDEDVALRTPSVLSLKNKWENLLKRQTLTSKPFRTESLRTSVKKDLPNGSTQKLHKLRSKAEEASTEPLEGKTENQNVNQGSKEETDIYSVINRTDSSRGSVRNIAKFYENDVSEKEPKSPPNTPSASEDDYSSSLDHTTTTSSPFSPLLSAKVNRHPPSKSLEELKRRFSTEGLNNEIQEENIFTTSQELQNSQTNKREISLGSLERKESVTKMKSRFETYEKISITSSICSEEYNEKREKKVSQVSTSAISSDASTAHFDKNKKDVHENNSKQKNTNEQNHSEKNKDLEKERSLLEKENASKATEDANKEKMAQKTETNKEVLTENIKEKREENRVKRTESIKKEKLFMNRESEREESLSKNTERVQNVENVTQTEEKESPLSENKETETDRHVMIRVNSNSIDLNSYVNNLDEIKHEETFSSRNENKSRIQELVKEFVRAEGLSNFLEVPKEECVSPTLSSPDLENVPSLSHIMKDTDTFGYPKLKDSEKIHEQIISQTKHTLTQKEEVEEKSDSHKTSQDLMFNTVSQSSTALERRSGSRQLKPDELKFFEALGSSQDIKRDELPTPSKGRERSSTIESDSPSSSLLSPDFAKSKLRSSSRQLHSDELKFFGIRITGAMSSKSLKGSDTSISKTVLEKVFASPFDEGEGGRKE